MEQVLCEPVELTEFELDQVAGGNPFNVTNNGASSTAFAGASFAIGAGSGEFFRFAFSGSGIGHYLRHKLRVIADF
jgi:hypothetical protein